MSTLSVVLTVERGSESIIPTGNAGLCPLRRLLWSLRIWSDIGRPVCRHSAVALKVVTVVIIASVVLLALMAVGIQLYYRYCWLVTLPFKGEVVSASVLSFWRC